MNIRAVILGVSAAIVATSCTKPSPPDPSAAPPAKSASVDAVSFDHLEPAVRDQLDAARERAASGEATDMLTYARTLHAYGFSDAAQQTYEQAAATGDDADAWYGLALLRLDAGDADGAAAALDRLLERSPDDERFNLRRAEADLARGAWDDAARRYEKVAAMTSALAPWAFAGAGRARLEAGDIDSAIEAFERALDLRPDLAAARYGYATALRMAGREEAAAPQFARAAAERANEPATPDGFLASVEALRTGAADALRRGIEARARAESVADMEQAAAHFAAAVRIDPDLGEAHAQLGATLAALGRTDDAIATLERALTLDPASADAAYNLGLLRYQAGDLASAGPLMERAFELRPDDFSIAYGVGVVRTAAGALDAGASALRAAIALQPTDPRPYRHLDRALAAAGRVDEAIAVLEQGLAAGPGSVAITQRLAWRLATAPDEGDRDPARALAMAERVVAAREGDPVAWETLAAALAAQGETPAAVNAARVGEGLARAAGDAAMANRIAAMAKTIAARESVTDSGQ